MNQVWLNMNDSITEFIYFGGPRQLEKCITNKINVNEEVTKRTGITRYLGAYLDSELNFREHIKWSARQWWYIYLK